MEYDAIQPFGVERENWHAAIIAQLIAAIHTPKNRRAPSVSDFMFQDAQARHREQEKEMLTWLRTMKRGEPS